MCYVHMYNYIYIYIYVYINPHLGLINPLR